MTDPTNQHTGEPGTHAHEFKIQIDRVHYDVSTREMTGEQLRHVPPTPIPETRDLYEVRPGEQDRFIGDKDDVEIRNGLRFFTAPHHINPGRAN